MKHLIQSLIISIAVIGIATPSFADGDHEDRGWDRDKKEQSHHSKKDKHHGNPFDKIMEQLDDLNDKLDELLAEGVDLRGVTQNWDKKLDSTNEDTNSCNSDRFTCLWPTDEFPDGAAVRDNETGLVWERAPVLGGWEWTGAIDQCINRSVGGRKGWHLPMREQLGTMADASGGYPAFPAVHPFINVDTPNPTNRYWSATTDADHLDQACRLLLGSGTLGKRR